MALISFIIIANVLFGTINVDLATLGNAAYFVFEFFCGNLKFKVLNDLIPATGFLYAFIFFICFNVILLPYFYGIIIFTYG